MRILYLAGWGRSGSTILSTLLDGLPGVFAAGEARSFWDRGLAKASPCACGRHVRDCEVWGAPAAAAHRWPMAADELAAFQRHHLRTRNYATAWPRLRLRGPTADEARYAETYGALHECLTATTQARLVLDSSKYPLDAHLLAGVAGVEVRVLHLVRDPRAVAYSWATPKALTSEPDAEQLKAFRPLSSSAIWTTWNAMVHRLLRDLPVYTVRYEDFAADPAATITSIASFAGVPVDGPVDLAALGRAATGHQVAGNPVRFATGEIRIVEDRRWKTAMPRLDRVAATLPALPLLRRYRYPAWP